MKYTTTILPILLLFSMCVGPTGPEGPAGKDGSSVVVGEKKGILYASAADSVTGCWHIPVLSQVISVWVRSGPGFLWKEPDRWYLDNYSQMDHLRICGNHNQYEYLIFYIDDQTSNNL